MVQESSGEVHHFSKFLMDPETGLSYDEPAPNTFSFNSPYGACSTCNGLGTVNEITEETIIPDKGISISRGGIAPLGEYRDIWIFKKIDAILKRNGFSLTTPIKDLPEGAIKLLLYGDNEPVAVSSVKYPGTAWHTKFEGIIRFLEKQKNSNVDKIQKWIQEYTVVQTCPECEGKRLKKESLHFKIAKKNIAELAELDILQLSEWFDDLEERIDERQRRIATEVLKEIRKRLKFLLNVGLDYLHLNRPLRSLSGECRIFRIASFIKVFLFKSWS